MISIGHYRAGLHAPTGEPSAIFSIRCPIRYQGALTKMYWDVELGGNYSCSKLRDCVPAPLHVCTKCVLIKVTVPSVLADNRTIHSGKMASHHSGTV